MPLERTGRPVEHLHRALARDDTSSCARSTQARARPARWSCCRRAVNLLDLDHRRRWRSLYGFAGFRNGAVVGRLSLVGFFGGAMLGAQIADPLGSHLADGRAQVPVAIVCVLFCAMLGQLALGCLADWWQPVASRGVRWPSTPGSARCSACCRCCWWRG